MADRPVRPVSYLSDARKALSDYARLRKQLTLVQADEKITLVMHRAIWGAAAALGIALALAFIWFWISWYLHERGWPSGRLAVLSLMVFGAPAAVCALQFTRPERKP